MRKPESGKYIPINELLAWVLFLKGISGITLSGGEPTEQIPALLTFLTEVRNKTNLSIIMFSGRTLEEIFSLQGGNELISLLDILIDGRFEETHINKQSAFPPSSNQKIHFLSNRYSDENFANLPFYEVIISEDGEILGSGISPVFGSQEKKMLLQES